MNFQESDRLLARLAALRPIETKHIQSIRAYWQIGLAYSSNALEGSTLTESETKVIIEDGITVAGKPLREHMEVIGHKDALQHLFEIYKSGYSEQSIKELHRLFYFRIDQESAGNYRKENVIITGTDFLPPKHETVPSLMGKFGANFSKDWHPVEHAAKAHEELVTIHPFVDGNGRTARLLMNLILLRAGYPIVIIPPIFRSQYIEASKAGNRGQSLPFLTLLTQSVEQSLTDYIRLLEGLS